MQTDSWLGIELRHLLALQAVAERRARSAVPRSASATRSRRSTQQIAALERIVGQRLIDRPGGPRPVTLTDAGALLLSARATPSTRVSQAAQRRPRGASATATPARSASARTSRSARASSPRSSRLPRRMAQGRHQARRVDRRPRALAARGAWRGRRQLLRAFRSRPGPFESVELMRDPYVLVVADHSPLAARDKPPTLREILELPLISYRTCRTTHGSRSGYGWPAGSRTSSSAPTTTARCRRSSPPASGVALVPRLTVDPADESIAVVELGERVPPRIIGVAWHADRQLTPAHRCLSRPREAVCHSKELAAA